MDTVYVKGVHEEEAHFVFLFSGSVRDKKGVRFTFKERGVFELFSTLSITGCKGKG